MLFTLRLALIFAYFGTSSPGQNLLNTDKTLKKIKSSLPRAMASDRPAIRGELSWIRRSWADPPPEKIQKKLHLLQKHLNASIRRKSWRRKNFPEPVYNMTLPIASKKDEIIEAIKTYQVLIISGETGSGKTTQIPKFCLAAGRGIEGMIGCTQPRRIAATTVSQRIAEELGEELGRSIGYKIRFKDRTGKNTFIKIMTDGILLAEAQNDPYLNEYDTLIVDEAHERSLNIDFVLGILKTLLQKRKDLKLIITSATIDTEKFSNAFDDAPVIEVSGRLYPVEVEYFSDESEIEENGEQTHIELAVNAVDHLQKKNPFGDVLVFMPTEQDIRETCELIEGRSYKGVNIMPLYARLPVSEQSRIFSNMPGRKIIVSTNVAETSITIPGIKYVIDTGLARISRYVPRSRTTSLPVVSISKSSADQRKGRCGRVESGICIRLYSEEGYQSSPLYTPPEILRANLAEVILRMIALNLENITEFPFIDRPAAKSIQDGFDLLSELDAITTISGTGDQCPEDKRRFRLTEKGRLMAKMPLDPRLSRMIIEAKKEGCLEEIAIIAAVLSIQDPRERPVEKAEEADRIHATFSDPSSDFISLLNIWNRYHAVMQKEKSIGRLKRFCRDHFLAFRRIREWRDIHAQISTILEESGLKAPETHKQFIKSESKESAETRVFSPLYTAIHKSILSGSLSNIAVKKEKNIFKATRGREVMIFPGSGLFNKAGEWIVAAEMVETTRVFARTAANIDRGWLEDLGREQCKRTYLQPHWERNRGEVVALEQVTLYGLIIVPQRRVSYGRINPEEASEIFIQYALVNGDVKKLLPFMEHNQKLIDEIKDMENRFRRRDLLVNEEEMTRFYKKRFEGMKIYDMRTLQKFIRKRGDDSFLQMTKEDLVIYSPDETELSLFPGGIVLGERSFSCSYRFDPGSDDDGVTVQIPSGIAPAVPSESTDWVVPGLLSEKITALIKGLPKPYRKKLVPVATTVDVILNELPKKEGSLITALSRFLYSRFGVDIPASAWPYKSLPDHLQMRMSLTGPKGEELHTSRDTSILRRSISSKMEPPEFESARKKWEKNGITRWDFGDLPELITIKGKDNTTWTVYLGLETCKNEKGVDQVNLRLFHHRNEAIRSHTAGVAALFHILFSRDLKFLKKKLFLPSKLQSQADYFGGAKRVERQIYESVTNDQFHKNIRTKDQFHSHAEGVAPNIFSTGQKKLDCVIAVLKAYHEARSTFYALENNNIGNKGVMEFLDFLREDLCRLVPEAFTELYDTERMVHIERYIGALTIRAQKGVINLEKDQARANELEHYTYRLNELLKELSPSVSEEKKNEIEEYFWLIEEYKVSLFAQELKTPFPVSKKRLDKKLKEIARMI